MNRLRPLPALTLALVGLGLSACGKAPSPPASAPAATLSAALQKTYDGSCRTCHSVAASGAPQAGDTAAWAPRLVQGRDTVLAHIINGYQKMPPMGLCMTCSEDDFVALTESMAGQKLP